ncbi:MULTISPECIES: hypothetical protein [Jeotgalibaca]|uniref:hypothetical protein n=1 Tax=Jeotgalibaca TaxID=1470540 RepID=UPI00359FC476
MKSYWYVTKCKLKPNRRGLVSVLLRKNYTIVELAVEADKDMEREFGLKYLGCGEFSDISIQRKLLTCHKRLS